MAITQEDIIYQLEISSNDFWTCLSAYIQYIYTENEVVEIWIILK